MTPLASQSISSALRTYKYNLPRLKEGVGTLEERMATYNELQQPIRHLRRTASILPDLVQKSLKDATSLYAQDMLISGLATSVLAELQAVIADCTRSPISDETRNTLAFLGVRVEQIQTSMNLLADFHPPLKRLKEHIQTIEAQIQSLMKKSSNILNEAWEFHYTNGGTNPDASRPLMNQLAPVYLDMALEEASKVDLRQPISEEAHFPAGPESADLCHEETSAPEPQGLSYSEKEEYERLLTLLKEARALAEGTPSQSPSLFKRVAQLVGF